MELLSAPVGAANTAPSVAPSASGSASAAPSASPTARAADGAELEERLEEKPYLGGCRTQSPEPPPSLRLCFCHIARYFPTAEDAEYFAKLSHGGLPRSSPNLLRWRLSCSHSPDWSDENLGGFRKFRRCSRR